jgi:hypothetical protein
LTKFSEIEIETPALHLVSGMPGGGKTATCFSIADRIHAAHPKRELYVAVTEGQVGPPDGLPKWIHSWTGSDYPLDSIVLLDDAQLQDHARRFGSSFNVEFDKLHSTLRHDNVDYILDSQTLKAIDVNNVLRSNYRWYKKPYGLDVVLGRPEIKRELETAQDLDLKKTEAYLVAETYSYRFDGKVTWIPLPPYWSPALSVMHRRREPGIAEKAKRWWRVY